MQHARLDSLHNHQMFFAPSIPFLKSPIGPFTSITPTKPSTLALLWSSTIPPNALTHHLSGSGTSRHPPRRKCAYSRVVGDETKFWTYEWCGGGFEREYTRVLSPEGEGGVGAQNPDTANTIPGGTVIRPCLKHNCDMETQLRIEPSASSVMLSWAAAMALIASAATSMSDDEVWPDVKLAGVAGVSSPSAGVRMEAWKILLLLEGGVSLPCSLETALRDVFVLARLTKRPTMKTYRIKNSMSGECDGFDSKKRKQTHLLSHPTILCLTSYLCNMGISRRNW